MALFKINASADFEGRSAGVLFREGAATIDTDTADKQHKRALAYFRQQPGYVITEVDENGDPVAQVDLDEVEPAEPVDEPPAELPELPPVTALKAEWVDAAVARGWQLDDVKDLTKPVLIDKLTSGELPPRPEGTGDDAEDDGTEGPA